MALTIDQILAVVTIPTSSDRAYYTQRVRLDGRDFNLDFAWNQREERWYLSIYDEDNQLVHAGIKILANWPLLRWYKFDDRIPGGELEAIDLTGDASPPTFDELGTDARCQLTYFGLTEL